MISGFTYDGFGSRLCKNSGNVLSLRISGIKMHWSWWDRRLYGNLRGQIINHKIVGEFSHSLGRMPTVRSNHALSPKVSGRVWAHTPEASVHVVMLKYCLWQTFCPSATQSVIWNTLHYLLIQQLLQQYTYPTANLNPHSPHHGSYQCNPHPDLLQLESFDRQSFLNTHHHLPVLWQ